MDTVTADQGTGAVSCTGATHPRVLSDRGHES